MAIDDILIDIIDVASGPGTTQFQPASGVEVIITTAGIEGGAAASDGVYEAYDGTLVTVIGSNEGSVTVIAVALKLGITNANYLQLKNQNAGTLAMCYSGVQVK